MSDCIGISQATNCADSIHTILVVRLHRIALSVRISKRTFFQLSTITSNSTRCIDTLACWIWCWEIVCTNSLCPDNITLVAVKFIAKRATCYLFLIDRCALYHSYLVEVVAIVELIVAPTEGIAIVRSCTFSKEASGVTVVQDGDYSTSSECHEAAIHRAARMTHLAKSCTIVEGDIAIEGTNHASVASHAAMFTNYVDICYHILHEHLAIAITNEGTIVDAARHHISFHTQVADSGSTYIAEEAAIVVTEVIAIGNGMSLAIESALEGIALRTNHHVGMFAVGQVDVSRQDAIHVCAFLNDLRKVIQVLSCGYFHHVFCRRAQASCRYQQGQNNSK